MVNYCCVYGCGRNSRQYSHLKFFVLPKERFRQIIWLKSAGRVDLLVQDKEKLSSRFRFCSRHFEPVYVKNRSLHTDAVPTLCLPGSQNEDEAKPVSHKDIVCNNCNSYIIGFRYKCITCDDYDLCQKCEMLETHSHHYMLRMPKSQKFKHTDNMLKKWRKLFKMQHVTPDCPDSNSDLDIKCDSESSDDEPINKYIKNYDSGVDLSEDVKVIIRKEVIRALESSKEEEELRKAGEKEQICNAANKKRVGDDGDDNPLRQISKRPRNENEEIQPEVNDCQPLEVVFADVNDVKTESSADDYANPEPVLHLKLSDDLSQITIEPMNTM